MYWYTILHVFRIIWYQSIITVTLRDSFKIRYQRHAQTWIVDAEMINSCTLEFSTLSTYLTDIAELLKSQELVRTVRVTRSCLRSLKHLNNLRSLSWNWNGYLEYPRILGMYSFLYLDPLFSVVIIEDDTQITVSILLVTVLLVFVRYQITIQNAIRYRQLIDSLSAYRKWWY